MRKSVFRPCIDLHDGQVKQIVGGTISDAAPDMLKTNFVARRVPPPVRPVPTPRTDPMRVTLFYARTSRIPRS